MIEIDFDSRVVRRRRCPASGDAVIEIRHVHEFADFPADAQKAAASFPGLQARARSDPAED